MIDKIKARLKRLKEISDPDVIEALEIALNRLEDFACHCDQKDYVCMKCRTFNSIAEKLGVS